MEAAKKSLRKLTEISHQAPALEVEAKSLRLQMDGVARTRDDAISPANERGWKASMFESRFRLLKDELDSLKRKK